MSPLLVIAGIPVWQNADKSLSWLGGMAIDGDGNNTNSYNDPDWQGDTSLHYQGKALNAEMDKFIVVPPPLIMAVAGVVLGCKALVTNTRNGRYALAVAGDRGPSDKLSEGSMALAAALGIDSNPLHGGTDDHVIAWMIWPNIPAECDGRTYSLQPS